MKKENKVTIVEISPRDGLPAVCKSLLADNEVMFINKLSQAGFKKIECASFLHPASFTEKLRCRKNYRRDRKTIRRHLCGIGA